MAGIALDEIRIASPCSASWEDMTGDDKVRFCGSCRQNVYNLSAMTRADAQSFVDASEGRHCLRFYRRADGTMLTRDCSCGHADGQRQMARLGTRFALLFGLMAGAAAVPRLVSTPGAPTSATPAPRMIFQGAPPPPLPTDAVAPPPLPADAVAQPPGRMRAPEPVWQGQAVTPVMGVPKRPPPGEAWNTGK